MGYMKEKNYDKANALLQQSYPIKCSHAKGTQ